MNYHAADDGDFVDGVNRQGWLAGEKHFRTLCGIFVSFQDVAPACNWDAAVATFNVEPCEVCDHTLTLKRLEEW